MSRRLVTGVHEQRPPKGSEELEDVVGSTGGIPRESPPLPVDRFCQSHVCLPSFEEVLRGTDHAQELRRVIRE